jgi:hypothetical protein
MPTYTLPPSTRSVGTADPPNDANALINILGATLGIAVNGTGTVTTGQVPLTPASVTLAAITGAVTSPLDVEGSTNAGQLAFIKQTGATDHALTVYLSGTGGTASSAVNVISDNGSFSALQVSGTETNRGTVKITHKGYSAATDGTAAAVSIDLQTTVGGVTGTAAQGIFITSTTDAAPAGNAITVRYNSSDWFVVKGSVAAGSGVVGIGVATGHVPAGMLEITQKDTTTPGLFMQAIGSGTDMVSLKDSGGTQRFQINNAGNCLMRANAFVSTSLQIGSVSSDFGGGSSCISIKHATDPSTNPTGGGIIYVDSSGRLCYRGSAGTITPIAVA